LTTQRKIEPIINTKTSELNRGFYDKIDGYKTKYNVVYPSDLPFSYEEKDSFPDALSYNDYLVDRVDLKDDLWTLGIDEESMGYALRWTDSLLSTSQKVVKTLEGMGSYNGFDYFRLSVIEYAKHFIKISSNELPEFIKIIRAPEMSDDDEKRAEAMLPKLDDKRDSLFAETEKNQFRFADSVGLDIVGRYNFEPNKKGIDYSYTETKTFGSPQDYNAYLANMVSIIDSLWTVTIDEENLKKALELNAELELKTSTILKSLNEMGAFDDDDSYRQSLIKYTTHLNSIAKNELKEFINIIRKSKMDADSEARAEFLLPVLDDKREELFRDISREQENFAKNFEFNLVPE